MTAMRGLRQVKAPKVYLRDSGLLHHLLGIRTRKDLLSHPKSGASWEGYALEELLKVADVDDFYFWGTHGGAELDHLAVIYPGETIYPLAERVTVLPLATLAEESKVMRLLLSKGRPRVRERTGGRKK